MKMPDKSWRAKFVDGPPTMKNVVFIEFKYLHTSMYPLGRGRGSRKRKYLVVHLTNPDKRRVRSIALGLHRNDVYVGCGISLLHPPKEPMLTTGDRELIISKILDDTI